MFLKEFLHKMKTFATEKKVDLELTSNSKIFINADKDLLCDIFTNLFDNSLKISVENRVGEETAFHIHLPTNMKNQPN